MDKCVYVQVLLVRMDFVDRYLKVKTVLRFSAAELPGCH